MPAQALRETIRVQGGTIPLLERHLARLQAGGCGSDVLDRARAEALRCAAEWPHAYGRLTLLVPCDGPVEATVSDRPSTIDIADGPTAALVPTAVPELPPGAAKPADRTFWDAALERAHAAGADVAVLVDDRGRLIDGSQATVWLVHDGTLLTPPSPPALAGVSRGFVLDVGPGLGLEVSERVLTTDDWDSAAEAFFTTAVAGAVAVRGRGGPVTDAVAAAFDRAFGLA